MQPLEAHHGLRDAHRAPAVRRRDRDGGIDPVAASGQQAQAALGGRLVIRLAEDAPAAGDHGIGCEHERASGIGTARDVARLGLGKAQDVGPRQLAGQRRLVDFGSAMRSGITPTWRSRASRRGDEEARISGARSGTLT